MHQRLSWILCDAALLCGRVGLTGTPLQKRWKVAIHLSWLDEYRYESTDAECAKLLGPHCGVRRYPMRKKQIIRGFFIMKNNVSIRNPPKTHGYWLNWLQAG